MKLFYDCIDCGTENCPCELAETGDCLVCSRLSGIGKCDCDWKGVCVYNEYVNQGGAAKRPRPEFEDEIIEKKVYGEDIVVLVIDTGRSFAQKCRRPGSYVFLKAVGDATYYNIPISVMRADEVSGLVHLAVKITGPKSRKIAEACGKVSVRGVYRNGIIGARNIIDIRGRVPADRKIMIVTKGIGFAPAVLIMDWIKGIGKADLYVDCDKLDPKIIDDYLGDYTGDGKCDESFKFQSIDLKEEFSYKGAKPGKNLLDYYSLGGYDTIVVLTSDYYIGEIRKLACVDACANNFHLCCGEGICGSCGHTDESGRCYRMCKCSEILASIL